MATIYANAADGNVSMMNSNWVTARDATAGTSASSGLSSASRAIQTNRSAARGGGYNYVISRVFMYFDTSGISSDVESATLKIYGSLNGGGDVIVVKSNSDILTLGTADFDSIVGWSTGADGSGAGDNSGNVTAYTSEISTWSTSGYNDITLNAQALADMRDDNAVFICILNYDYDLLDIEPTGSSFNGLFYANYTGTSRDPYIDYELAPAVTDNAVFFGCNF